MVYFIGAGSGDPELLTIKGKRLIDQADIVIYTGSLVNAEILKDSKAKIYNSAGMNLDEVIELIQRADARGLQIARVHTGDPSIYGAYREQVDRLKKLGIDYEVVPGVSSFLAAAATLGVEYTLPNISQTVILTRLEGRTPVPSKEKIEELAKHQTSMVVFLSIGKLEELATRLMTSYSPITPAAVVYKASWKEEKVVRGILKEIAQKVKEEGITKTALLLVGDFLGNKYGLSKLYDKHFSHEFRNGIESKE